VTRAATLQTIADRVGVSRATVSNAFSRPDQLSAELRMRILAVADDLGYAGPDPTARMLARGSTGTVGVLLSGSLRHAFTDEVLTTFLGAVADALGPTGLALTLLAPGDHGPVVPARDVAMDGALVCSVEPGSDAVGWLTRRGVPLVLVDQAPVEGTAGVTVDDRLGARAAAEHLLDLGHRHVGVLTTGLGRARWLVTAASAGNTAGHTAGDVTEDVTGYVARQRLLGWLDPLRPAGARVVVSDQPFAYDDASAAARRLLDVADPPTAVLCFSDAMAADLVRTAEALGARVPADLSVIGFDDSPLARRMRPALTTVRQDVDAKGRAAAAALRRVIDASGPAAAGAAQHVLLPTGLVVRGTTAPPGPTPPSPTA
jgi:DNA-binding LacI/PurR family transcriptional regulator